METCMHTHTSTHLGLEAQVNHLIAVNQLLVKRLQFQAFLNSQVARLRYLVAEFLVD